MATKAGSFVHWTPRILSVLFVAFMALFSFDVFGGENGFWNEFAAFLIHNIPSFVLLAVLLIAWRYELVGVIAFALFGVAFAMFTLWRASQDGFNWSIPVVIAVFAGIAWFIAALYYLGWSRKRKA